MKNLSIKARLVIVHTLMMSLVVIIVLGILFSISGNEIDANVRTALEDRVNESYENIAYRDGMLTFNNDFIEIQDGIYLSAYELDSTELLYGRLPYGFEYNLVFEEGNIREIAIADATYYVYDMSVPIEGYHTIMIRGVVSIADAQREFRATLRITLILLPILIILTALVGYIISKRAMRPVKRITDTVKEIRSSHDLSKRVKLGKGNDEIYRLAHTFDELLSDVDSAFKREKQFTSDVAHELRTPITTVKIAIDDILKRDDLDKELKEELMIIQKKNDMMAKMVSELLALSRADQGRLEIKKEKIDLSDLTLMILDSFKEMIKDDDIDLLADIDPEIYIEADEVLIMRLYNNVLENARKFTKSKISVTLKSSDDKVSISVSDDGIGIKDEDKEKIFDRFYQADTSRNKEGSGLGLSMVKWIAEVHDMSIDVRSTLGEGTTFTFIAKRI